MNTLPPKTIEVSLFPQHVQRDRTVVLAVHLGAYEVDYLFLNPEQAFSLLQQLTKLRPQLEPLVQLPEPQGGL